MTRLRIALVGLVLAILASVVVSAGAADEPPTLKSTPKAALGKHVVITGLFFTQFEPATLYLESGTRRTRLGSKMVPRGGQLTLAVKLPKTAPKNAHLLVCQHKCASRVRLALAR